MTQQRKRITWSRLGPILAALAAIARNGLLGLVVISRNRANGPAAGDGRNRVGDVDRDGESRASSSMPMA
jgi:hypothetical protein